MAIPYNQNSISWKNIWVVEMYLIDNFQLKIIVCVCEQNNIKLT